MDNLIPRWIADSWDQQEHNGEFPAFGLFLDLSGFTALTEALMEHGKAGAEALSVIINDIFEPVLNELHAVDGFVTTFAGDAFTAVIPASSGRSAEDVVVAARLMMGCFVHRPIHQTPWGEFVLDAKIGLGRGKVEWGILEGPTMGYYFRGEAIEAAAEAEHRCESGTLAWSRDFPVPTPKEGVEKDGYVVFKPTLVKEAVPTPPTEKAPVPEELAARFWPVSDLPKGRFGEFRTLVSVFIRFDQEPRPLSEVFAVLSGRAQQAGGHLNVLDFGDKGGIILVLFGAPLSLERPLDRAFDFALHVREDLPHTQQGLAYGRAFVGYVGSPSRATYTALGPVINLSARLCTSAQIGQILFPEALAKELSGLRTEVHGDVALKGFSQPVSVARLLGKDSGATRFDLPEGQGREAERQKLSAWLEALAGGSGGTFSIYGEAGLGKSQLASDALSKTSLDYRILTSDPVFRHAFRPLVPLAEEWFDEAPAEARPALAALTGRVDEAFDRLDPQARHDRTIEALALMLRARSERAPLLLVVENAQAIDAASNAVLTRLASEAKALGVLKLIRSDKEFAAPNQPATVVLLPFTDAEITELVQARTGRPPTAALKAFLAYRTSRIPLYLAELVRLLQDSGYLRIREPEIDLLPVKETQLPASLDSLILAQVDRLPPSLRTALPQLAVLGSAFPLAVVRALFGTDDPTNAALEHRVLRAEPGDLVAFRQEFLREAVIQRQLESHIANLHQRAGEAFEAVWPDLSQASAEKAYHFLGARQNDKARAAFLRAGELAFEKYQNTEALEHLESFLKLSDDDHENGRVRLLRARIFELVGEWTGARAELERGIGLAALAGDEDRYALFFAFLGQIKFKQGDLPAARAYLQKAVRDPRSTSLSPELVQCRIDLARVHILAGEYGPALARLLEAQDLAVEQSYDLEHGLALYYQGVVFRSRNRRSKALEAYNESLALLRRLGKDRYVTYPLYDLSLLAQAEGRLEQAEAFMEEARAIYERIGYKSGLGAALLNLGAIQDQRGEFQTALDYYRRSREITEQLGEELGVAYALFSMGANAFRQREYPQALSYLTDAHERIERLGVESYKGYTLSYFVSVLVKLDRGDEAVRRALEQLDVIDKTGQDVEKGRIFLALAELVAERRTLSDLGRRDWAEVLRRSGVKAAPSAFYLHAIQAARAEGYMNTLIPALYEFGLYLRGRGKHEAAAKALHQTAVLARRGGWARLLSHLESLKETP